MDEKQALTQEMILEALMNKSNENTDVLEIIWQLLLDIKGNTENISSKLDTVLNKLNSLETDFSDLKNETREIEQKVLLLDSKLNKLEDAISKEELEDYCGMCQGLYNNWDELDSLTKKLIPVAEYLFSKLQKYDKPDYSPVILELCRALENEFLLKIFRKYTFDLISRKGNSLDSFFIKDRATGYLVSKTGQFVKAITKASRTKKPEYTLGQMNTIMSLMNKEDIVYKSPLLQDFRLFLNNKTIVNDLLDIKYIKKINYLVENYRNPAAHPEAMSMQQALKCKEILPGNLDYLMNCLI